jgi:hypothetical protein
MSGARVLLAAVAYHAATLVRSRRIVPPLAALLLVVLGVYAYSPDPVAGSTATTSFLLFPLAAWLAVAIAASEGPSQRDATATALGGPLRAAAARFAAGVALGGAGVAILVLGPVALRAFDRPLTAGDLLLATWIHLAALLAGLALGGLVAPPVLRRPGAAMALAVTVWVLGVPVDALAADAPSAARPLLYSAAPHAYAAEAIGGASAWPDAAALLAAGAAGLAFAAVGLAAAAVVQRWR